MSPVLMDITHKPAEHLSSRVAFARGARHRARQGKTMAPQARKLTQRARLLDGMIETANRRGYAGATVSAVIAEAGVSRPTFYDYFADREDCFLATIAHVSDRLAERARAALEDRGRSDALAGVIAELIAFAQDEPGPARFLMAESMAGGAAALELRDGAIGSLAAMVERKARGAPAQSPLVDLDPRVAIGSVVRMLAMRLRRGEVVLSGLADELAGWAGSYERPAGERRWAKLTPGPKPAPSPHVPEVQLQQMPSLFPKGRPRIPGEQVIENHRLRMLYAVARLAQEKGYQATTVADITRLARVDGRAFYRLFADKQEAFAAAHELGFQQVMDVTGKAFFSVSGWPERSWEAGAALTQLLQANPIVAHVGFVEAYAVGPAAVQRIEDSHTAFMFFLQEGLMETDSPPSRVGMEAIIAGIFEILYLQARRGARMQVDRMLGQIAHLWLTPFLGVQESDAFIDARLRGGPARRRAAGAGKR